MTEELNAEDLKFKIESEGLDYFFTSYLAPHELIEYEGDTDRLEYMAIQFIQSRNDLFDAVNEYLEEKGLEPLNVY